MVDDQIYLQQGALCEQCHVPLVPAQNFQQQWGQQPMNAQWGQQPAGMDAQWGQQPMNAQWGQQPAGMDAQWGQQPMNSQWGQQPVNSQWGQQPVGMDAQFGQNPPGMNAQFGQNPPGMNAQFGQNPPGMDAQFGQNSPGMDAQFGQQPLGAQNQWGTQAQWSQMADKPMETEAFMEPISPVNHGSDAGEKTMAIDADWESAGLGIGAAKNEKNNDGWDDWGDKSNKAPAPPKLPKSQGPKSASGYITIGQPMDPTANENVTREIDLADVQKIYGDKVNPIKDFIISIPPKYFIISGAVVGVTVILFIVFAIILSRPEEVQKEFTKDGDLITEDTPEQVMSFDEKVAATKSLSSNFLTFDGEDITEGMLAAVTKSGIYYNNKKIAEYDEITRGEEGVAHIIDTISADIDNIGKPVYVLFEETIPMHAVYRMLYSVYAASRTAFLSGITTSGITPFELHPCEWPDHGMVSIADERCKQVTLHLKITPNKMTLRRINSNESLLLDEETVVTELQDDIRGSRVNTENTGEAFNRMRIKNRPPIQIAPDGDVPLNVFMYATLAVRGQENNPNTTTIYLNRVSKY